MCTVRTYEEANMRRERRVLNDFTTDEYGGFDASTHKYSLDEQSSVSIE
jgi:hypothetical protein